MFTLVEDPILKKLELKKAFMGGAFIGLNLLKRLPPTDEGKRSDTIADAREGAWNSYLEELVLASGNTKKLQIFFIEHAFSSGFLSMMYQVFEAVDIPNDIFEEWMGNWTVELDVQVALILKEHEILAERSPKTTH